MTSAELMGWSNRLHSLAGLQKGLQLALFSHLVQDVSAAHKFSIHVQLHRKVGDQ